MKKLALLVIGLVLYSTPLLAGEFLMNDTGETAVGSCVVFSEPVMLTGFGDVLTSLYPDAASPVLTFSGGELAVWEGHWLSWEPATVPRVALEWITETTLASDSSSPDVQPTGSPFPIAVVASGDRDGDGLPDAREAESGCNPDMWDSDGDGLSDYAEIVKHRTDPLVPDSDGDGIGDGDWQERREYAYTIEIELKLRRPFDVSSMNDLYQDARLLRESSNGYAVIDVILYPEAEHQLEPLAFPSIEYPSELRGYLQPGIATSYDAEMQPEVEGMVAAAKTDVDAVNLILRWVDRYTSSYLPCSIPEVYYTTLDANGNVDMPRFTHANSRMRFRSGWCDIPSVDDILRNQFFAVSMFKGRVHGTCTSVATLKCAMIRAAGIPCRLIYTVPVLYYNDQQTEPFEELLSDRTWFRQSHCVRYYSGDSYMKVNHAFLQVWLGGHWVRVDRAIGGMYGEPDCLFVNILSLHDWTDVDFSSTYPVNWAENRPYYTLRVADQHAIHKDQ